MRFALFYHSVRSDWNHGNAHFLRGVVRALQRRGHRVTVFEPDEGWSCRELVKDQGTAALEAFGRRFPDIRWQTYPSDGPDLESALDGVDVVVAHEWTDPALLARLGRHRLRHSGMRLLFHDTHHRMVSEPHAMRALDLEGYDGVLAFGEVLAEAYRRMGWGRRAYTWHEAADVTTFHPRRGELEHDVLWVGNWGDGERERELSEYLLEPVRRTGSRLRVHGVRYPPLALRALEAVGAEYRGWIAGPDAARAYARACLTVHVPRRWYRQRLPGIPTIRVFEALACGTPLVSAPWQDTEGLFERGEDFLMARDGEEMTRHMRRLLADPEERTEIARNGARRILARHTCDHRALELEHILSSLGASCLEEPVSS